MSRNVVLVTYDSLRADHCGFMGYDRDTTPTLDEMANEGVVFENAIASGVPTIASMTAVMTGEHSLASPEIGFNQEQREQVTARPTIAEVLSDAGYSTGALSPNPPASSYFGFDEGFDWFEDFLAEDRGVFERLWHRVFQHSIEGGSLSTYLRLFRNVVQREEVLRPWEDFYDDIVDWCRQASEPYFLWVLLLEPHHPWFPPAEQQRWSSRRDKYRSFQHYWEMLNSGWEPDFDAEVRQRLVDLYDDSIRYGDAFLDHLRDDLAGDDPVFVVHADHGEEFGEHGRYGHQPYLSEELIHVPLVISGVGRSRNLSNPVGLRNLAPTIAELAGTDHPFDGPDLLSASHDRPWATAKVFPERQRRLVLRMPEARYQRYDGRDELVEPVTGAKLPNNIRQSLEPIVDRCVADEHERRGIRSGVSHVIAESGDTIPVNAAPNRENAPAELGGD